MSDMNKCWTCIYDGHENINKGEIRGPGQGNGQFLFYFKFSRAPPPPARKFKVKIEIDHFGEGPGAYITYISFNGTNKA